MSLMSLGISEVGPSFTNSNCLAVRAEGGNMIRSQARTRNPAASTVRRQGVYSRRKDALYAFLGNCCSQCGTTEDLTADHKSGSRDWEPRDVHSTKRMRIYLQEAMDGKIQLLCRAHNASKSDSPEDDETF